MQGGEEGSGEITDNAKTDKMKYLRDSFIRFFQVFWFPTFIFHELCHIVALLLLPVNDWHLCKKESYIKIDEKGFLDVNVIITHYHYEDQYIPTMIISCAPVIGWLIAYAGLFLTCHYFIASYFVFGYTFGYFSLSKVDIMSFNQMLEKRKSIIKKAATPFTE